MRNDIQKLREKAAGMNILSLSESRRFLMDVVDVLDRLDQAIRDLEEEMIELRGPVVDEFEISVEGLVAKEVFSGTE